MSAHVATAASLPLHVLGHCAVGLADLGAAGGAGISTGSALYRHALGAAIAAAAATRAGLRPGTTAVDYSNVRDWLRSYTPPHEDR